ncbi:MinD-like ATPase involved in chromosome partitioning or flagellar assembly [Arthrobacter sp. SLBN-83]|uniref:AAA family ATPase n=1 Tax=Arthrobacter sp. SLBN-83 TaxID=2768449 RepID=UPI00114E9514|nr:P-loop NTPase [Arthrobacter sp. SLBN-83]TQJ60423.1 MinD-like ATPase involved in chromosome partitioning or flagellar assembly [Arthrobacter sp. SLBN-83]
MNIPVVTVGQSREDLVGGLERLHGPVTVVRRCAELPELLAACQSGLARAAVVADGSEGLTASLVDRLGAVGVAVIALTDNAEEAARLRKIGAASALTGVESAELSDRIADAVAQLTGAARPGSLSAAADPAAALATDPAEPEQEAEGRGSGQLIVVWGPAGSPGRTTVAVNIAGEMAADGQEVLLVDADTYGASVAAVLGLLDESAGLAQACRLADHGQLDADALRKVAAVVATASGQFRVLTGITRADRWTEIRATALALVLERAREIADVVVVDTGFCLEADEELSFDTMAPRRNAATLRPLELADTVYAIGAADPVGVPRMVRALAELEDAVPQASPTVLMNKVRSSSVGRDPERQLRDAWERYGPAPELKAFLPHDPRAADAALLGGSLLLEAAPESDLRRAIRGLVCASDQRKRKSSVFSSTPRRRAKD